MVTGRTTFSADQIKRKASVHLVFVFEERQVRFLQGVNHACSFASDAQEFEAIRRGDAAGLHPAQLCKLVEAPPHGDDWVHEAKLDGYRMQLHVKGGRAIFYSRRGLDWTHRFPEIVAAAPALGDCIMEGEVCAVDAQGLPSFSGLTDALTAKRTSALIYYVFDMMGAMAKISLPILFRPERKSSERCCAN